MRALLLRPGQPPDNLVYPGDDHPDAFHGGAFEGERLVGITSIYPEAPPEMYRGQLPGGDAFRLRGMATNPDVRGKGHGRDLLHACIDHMRAKDASLLWCNARVIALDFYKHLGLRTIGPEFEIEGIGPHYVMWKAVV
ncbi:MAG: GNAT family N-acetyltransferase [Bacteroidetes bacterium]|nr:GNAT family N-acetyltransferase [Bacteroidota bacterium]